MEVQLNAITSPLIPGEEMNPEEYMIYCARVSSDERLNNDTAPKLLDYLIRAGHWSPFEMISIGIEIKTSRAIAQQILRHRSFSFQEFSQRYAKVTDMEPVQFRQQAIKNRQSSTEEITNELLVEKANRIIELSQDVYSEMIDAGVAKECARMILPLTTQTTIVMHGTLRSWIHFFNQRCDEHAQLEIQQLAYAARDEVARACPWTAKALNWSKSGEAL